MVIELTSKQPGLRGLALYNQEVKNYVYMLQRLLRKLDAQLREFYRFERLIDQSSLSMHDQIPLFRRKNFVGYSYLEVWDQLLLHGHISYDEETGLHCLRPFISLSSESPMPLLPRAAYL